MTKLSRDLYKVGWICPMDNEQIAALEMLDEEYDPSAYHRSPETPTYITSAGLKPTMLPSKSRKLRHHHCGHANENDLPESEIQSVRRHWGGVPVEIDSGVIRLGRMSVSEPTTTHSGAIQYA
ncbi:hypothetical protein N7490_002151 [Penicillium lividum]|nr:hypothetical protein N7490_002151 [Penicillium lividum]